jgi:hypothetical protein
VHPCTGKHLIPSERAITVRRSPHLATTNVARPETIVPCQAVPCLSGVSVDPPDSKRGFPSARRIWVCYNAPPCEIDLKQAMNRLCHRAAPDAVSASETPALLSRADVVSCMALEETAAAFKARRLLLCFSDGDRPLGTHEPPTHILSSRRARRAPVGRVRPDLVESCQLKDHVETPFVCICSGWVSA